ncbi:MAG: hypothetical protein M0C28_46900 [Candidatus Moduliflexus flocculans]|nr:hypothetical protein [Candidatus Moduliflexus flocculans]
MLDGSERVDAIIRTRHPLGRDGRGRPPRLGAQRSLHRNLHRVQRAAAGLGPHHAAVSGGRGAA